MRYFLILFLLLFACAKNNDMKTEFINYDPNDLFQLSINDYKEMLKNYNKNSNYPSIDN